MNNEIKNNNFLKQNEYFVNVLYEFIKKVYSSHYEYKVLVTRRSYVLFKIFERRLKDERIPQYGELFNTNSIVLLKKRLNEKNGKVLIVDDIIINGRTIRDIFNSIKALNNENMEISISIFPLYINKQAKCFDEDMIKSCIYSNFVTEVYWRKKSDKINEFIALCLCGYTSYINSYSINSNSLLLENVINDYECELHPLDNKIYKNNGINSYLLFLDEIKNNRFYEISQLNSFLAKYNIVSILRFYSKDDTILIIPYAYLPTIQVCCFEQLFSNILSAFNIDSNRIVQNLRSITSDEGLYNESIMFLYKWLTCFLSERIKEVFLHSFVKYFKPCEVTVELSCFESFREYYQLGQFEEWSLNCKIDCSEKLSNSLHSFDAPLDKKCYDIFKKIYLQHKNNHLSNCDECLTQYLYIMRTEDQLNADINIGRHKGIRVEDVLSVVNHNEDNSVLSFKDVIASFISEWDSGNGSGVVSCFISNDELYICNSLINGEVIYRYPFNRFVQETCDFYIYFNNSLTTDPYKLKQFADYMDKELCTSSYNNFISVINKGVDEDFFNGIMAQELDNSLVSKHYSMIISYISTNS